MLLRMEEDKLQEIQGKQPASILNKHAAVHYVF